jgi:NTE family protein
MEAADLAKPRKATTGAWSGRRLDLVLGGGGALGAFQADVYEALEEAGLEPDRLAGTSIGALNAALIAGNPPERRLARLRAFWELVAERGFGPAGWSGDTRRAIKAVSAFRARLLGRPGSTGRLFLDCSCSRRIRAAHRSTSSAQRS